MLSPHEIATLLLAAASLGPIDADALEPPDLAALEQARLVHVAVDEGQAKVIVTEDGHRVLRRLGLERSVAERADAPRMVMANAARASQSTETRDASQMNGRPASVAPIAVAPASGDAVPSSPGAPQPNALSATAERGTASESQQAAALPAEASEGREEQA